MNIQFDTDIWQFKDKTQLEIINKTKLYRKYYSDFLSPIIDFVNFDSSKINEIKIIKFDDSYGYFGKVIPIEINNELKFNILYCDVVFLWYGNQNNPRYNYAKGVIAHEFYHCKEMIITSKYIDFHKLYFHGQIDTTYKYIFDLAVTQFSEYYAHFYSSKLYTENKDFEKTIFNSDISLTVLKDALKNEDKVPMYKFQKENIESFICNCIIQIARYHSTKDETYIHVLDCYKNSKNFSNHYLYFIRLADLLNEYLIKYPENMSEECLMSFGKLLFSIFNLYKITFSTEDLSDNFEFCKLEQLL